MMTQTVEKNPLPQEDPRTDKPGISGGPALAPMKEREAARSRMADEGPVPIKPGEELE